MFLDSRHPYLDGHSLPIRRRGLRSLVLIGFIFALGFAAGSLLPWQKPARGREPAATRSETKLRETVWPRNGNSDVRHPVEVIRAIDGDTFEARVHLWPGLDMTTRVRLRGIDAPELKAGCPQELDKARAASEALESMLAEGSVTIFNIGPDKYNGRVVADAATRQTPNVSQALLAAGYARFYGGGRRSGWCSSAGR